MAEKPLDTNRSPMRASRSAGQTKEKHERLAVFAPVHYREALRQGLEALRCMQVHEGKPAGGQVLGLAGLPQHLDLLAESERRVQEDTVEQARESLFLRKDSAEHDKSWMPLSTNEMF